MYGHTISTGTIRDRTLGPGQPPGSDKKHKRQEAWAKPPGLLAPETYCIPHSNHHYHYSTVGCPIDKLVNMDPGNFSNVVRAFIVEKGIRLLLLLSSTKGVFTLPSARCFFPGRED